MPITDHHSRYRGPAERSLLLLVISGGDPVPGICLVFSEHGSDWSGLTSWRTSRRSSRAGEPAALAQIQEGTQAAALPSSTFAPGSERLRRRMGFLKMEEYTIDSFELLYSGAVDKIKSHKSNLNLSKFNVSVNLLLWRHYLLNVGRISSFYHDFQPTKPNLRFRTILLCL